MSTARVEGSTEPRCAPDDQARVAKVLMAL
jgi:hypothetical protein